MDNSTVLVPGNDTQIQYDSGWSNFRDLGRQTSLNGSTMTFDFIGAPRLYFHIFALIFMSLCRHSSNLVYHNPPKHHREFIGSVQHWWRNFHSILSGGFELSVRRLQSNLFPDTNAPSPPITSLGRPIQRQQRNRAIDSWPFGYSESNHSTVYSAALPSQAIVKGGDCWHRHWFFDWAFSHTRSHLFHLVHKGDEGETEIGSNVSEIGLGGRARQKRT